MTRRLLFCLMMVPIVLDAQSSSRLSYPDTRKVDQVDDFFGTKVADPYRWLEDDNSAETAAWVAAENKVTFAYLERIAARPRLKQRLTELWNYERYGIPSKEGPFYIYTKNNGLQNQAVVYKSKTLDGTPEVLIDPNAWSKHGTIALTVTEFSDDGKYMAYATASAGSDWHEWKIRNVETGQDLSDHLKWSKFSGAAWLPDGSGFYYGRYDVPKTGDELQGVNKNQKLFFHKVGTSQDADTLVYERPDHPTWLFDAAVTEDGRFLVITQREGTERENRVFIRDLKDPAGTIAPFLDKFDAQYGIVGNDGDRFYVLTDNGAPRFRLVAIDRSSPDPSSWKTLIGEGPRRDVIATADIVGSRFIVTWRIDAHETLKVYGLDGKFERDVPMPTLGAIGGVLTKRKWNEAFYSFASYTYPTTIFHLDMGTGKSAVLRQPKVAFSPSEYETTQVFYTSKDGTKIPMFLTAKKGLPKNGQNPTYLYGYGGFDISMTPSFSASMVAWLEMGGIYAVANLRGGGEYGKPWHDAGRLHHKQNVFDDFIAAAEYLIKEKYTSTPKLAIAGGSNGGLLVGACMTQRPDLFGAALPAVGVMDMLRFHKFTIGWAWTSDYGSSETKADFDTLIKYSPLQNLKPGTKYPATMVTTADHDDRVVPAHSFKFAAALQAAQAGDAPVLIRIETEAGHGAGKPTEKLIQEKADQFAFLVDVLRMEPASSSRE